MEGLSDTQLEALYADCDVDQDGQLTLEEFTNAVARFYKETDPENFESALRGDNSHMPTNDEAGSEGMRLGARFRAGVR